MASGNTNQQNWFERIGHWLVFVKRRRIDPRFKVWQPLGRNVFLLLAYIALVIFLIRFVDGPFLELVRSGETRNSLFMRIITNIGKSDWILLLCSTIMVVMSFLTPERYTGRRREAWHRVFLSSWCLFSSVALTGLAVILIKYLVGRARPAIVQGSGPFEYFPMIGDYEFASFPSGHATTAGVMAVGLAYLFPRLRGLFLGLGVLVAASRSFIGVHFPSDIAAGFFFGAGFAYFWARGFARKRLLFGFTEDGGVRLRNMDGLGSGIGSALGIDVKMGGK